MRDYDPTTGRYLQADPLGLVDGPSVYRYALQNPGRYTDFWGLQAGVFNADGTIGLPGDFSNPQSGSQSLLGGGIKVGTGIAGGIATGILLAITPTAVGSNSDYSPTVSDLDADGMCDPDDYCHRQRAEDQAFCGERYGICKRIAGANKTRLRQCGRDYGACKDRARKRFLECRNG